MRLRGSFLAAAADSGGSQPVLPCAVPVSEPQPAGMAPSDGLVLVFEPDARPAIGAALRPVRSPTAIATERVWLCPSGAAQFADSLTVRALVAP